MGKNDEGEGRDEDRTQRQTMEEGAQLKHYTHTTTPFICARIWHPSGRFSVTEHGAAGGHTGWQPSKQDAYPRQGPLISVEPAWRLRGEVFLFSKSPFSRFTDQLPNPKQPEGKKQGSSYKRKHPFRFSGHTRLSRPLQKCPDSLSGYLKDSALLTALFKWSNTLHFNPGACGAGLHPGVCTFVGPPQNEWGRNCFCFGVKSQISWSKSRVSPLLDTYWGSRDYLSKLGK